MQQTVDHQHVIWLTALTLLSMLRTSKLKDFFIFSLRIFAGMHANDNGQLFNNQCLKAKKQFNIECVFISFDSSSVRIYFKEKVRFAGISAYHFETGDDFLKNVGPKYGNECYCIDKISSIPSRPNGCLHKGAIDLSNCQGKFNRRCTYSLSHRPINVHHMHSFIQLNESISW